LAARPPEEQLLNLVWHDWVIFGGRGTANSAFLVSREWNVCGRSLISTLARSWRRFCRLGRWFFILPWSSGISSWLLDRGTAVIYPSLPFFQCDGVLVKYLHITNFGHFKERYARAKSSNLFALLDARLLTSGEHSLERKFYGQLVDMFDVKSLLARLASDYSRDVWSVTARSLADNLDKPCGFGPNSNRAS